MFCRISIVVLAALSLSGKAQDLDVGFEGGYLFNLSDDDKSAGRHVDKLDFQSTPYLSAKISLLKNRFRSSVSISFHSLIYKIRNSSTDLNYYSYYRANSKQFVPALLLEEGISLTKKFELSPTVGLEIFMPINGWYQYHFESNFLDEFIETEEKYDYNSNMWISVPLGLQFVSPFFGNFKIELSTKYSFGLNGIQVRKDEDDKYRMNTFLINAGVLYRFNLKNE